VLLGIGCAVVEMSRYGDIGGLDYNTFDKKAQFKQVGQYDSYLVQRKKPFAQIMLCFSPLRNLIKVASPNTYVAYRIAQTTDGKIKKTTKYMRLFNGIKGISILYFIFGSTYMFAWYAIIGNYYDLDEMRKTYTFSIVTGAYYMAPIGFFTGGFL
jgi:hypothetical protein